jgi:hypothetical protein
MRNLLALLATAILTVAGLGWYLDWYKVRSQPASVPGQRSVGIDINTHKISEDLHQGEEKLQNFLDSKTKEQAKQPESKPAADGKSLTLPSINVNLDKGPSIQLNAGR